uniref:Rhodopsin n=1 Tax=Ictalurus punctatus TaxID=7998 RepID=W5U9A1_ICTPU
MNGTEGPDFYIPMSNATGVVRSPHEYPQYYLAEPWVFSFLTIYMFFLIIVGFPVNLFTLVVTVLHKKLRTPIYYILVNIAVVDLFVIAVSFPFTMHAAMHGYFVRGQVGCNFEGFFGGHGILTTLWCLVVLAVERCMVSFRPGMDIHSRRRFVIKGVRFIWLMAFSWSLPPLFEWSRYIPEGLQCSCGVDYYTLKPELFNESFINYMFTVHVVVPLTVISVCLGRLLCVVNSDALDKTERDANRVTVVMTLGFFVCWLPYVSAGWHIFSNQGSAFSPLTMTLTAFFAKSAVVHVPLLFIAMDKPLRQCMFITLCQIKNHFADDDGASKSESSSASVAPA